MPTWWTASTSSGPVAGDDAPAPDVADDRVAALDLGEGLEHDAPHAAGVVEHGAVLQQGEGGSTGGARQVAAGKGRRAGPRLAERRRVEHLAARRDERHR